MYQCIYASKEQEYNVFLYENIHFFIHNSSLVSYVFAQFDSPIFNANTHSGAGGVTLTSQNPHWWASEKRLIFQSKILICFQNKKELYWVSKNKRGLLRALSIKIKKEKLFDSTIGFLGIYPKYICLPTFSKYIYTKIFYTGLFWMSKQFMSFKIMLELCFLIKGYYISEN